MKGRTISPEEASGCCEAVAVCEGVRGLTLAKKLELISPIPIKKSSARCVSDTSSYGNQRQMIYME
jgi:hypothetical protein